MVSRTPEPTRLPAIGGDDAPKFIRWKHLVDGPGHHGAKVFPTPARSAHWIAEAFQTPSCAGVPAKTLRSVNPSIPSTIPVPVYCQKAQFCPG